MRNPRWSIIASLWLLSLLITQTACQDAAIFSAWTSPNVGTVSYGSTAGGTLVTVTGIGFDKSTAIVFLGWFACNVIPYYSTSESLVCETPPLAPENSQYEYVNVEITVYTAGIILRGCRTYGTCYFMYRPDRTPVLSSIFPMEAVVGDTITLNGYFYISSLFSIRKISIGNQLCTFDLPEVQFSDSVDWTYYSQVQCSISSPDTIYSNATMNILSEYGNTASKNYRVRYLPSKQSYMFVTVPAIYSVSRSQSSLKGGLVLTIRGAGFSKEIEKNSVTIDEVPCTVSYSDTEMIQCTTSPASTSASSATKKYFKGGRGANRSIYMNIYGNSIANLRQSTRFPMNPDTNDRIPCTLR